jgi:hypothetical protein
MPIKTGPIKAKLGMNGSEGAFQYDPTVGRW